MIFFNQVCSHTCSSFPKRIRCPCCGLFTVARLECSVLKYMTQFKFQYSPLHILSSLLLYHSCSILRIKGREPLIRGDRFSWHSSAEISSARVTFQSMDLKNNDGRSIERGEVEKKSREGHASLPEREAAQARAGAYSRIEVLCGIMHE
jgi:hypothetical protein